MTEETKAASVEATCDGDKTEFILGEEHLIEVAKHDFPYSTERSSLAEYSRAVLGASEPVNGQVEYSFGPNSRYNRFSAKVAASHGLLVVGCCRFSGEDAERLAKWALEPKLAPESREALLRVKQTILEEPRRLNMQWIATPLGELQEDERPPCGTVCCIAGWLIMASHPHAKPQEDNDHFLGDRLGNYGLDTAYEALPDAALGGPKYGRLFYNFRWPTRLKDAYDSAKTPKARAEATAAAIDNFIATGGWQSGEEETCA